MIINLSQISQITQIFIHGYTAAQPRLIITNFLQPITAARPERSNARAERVARSRGVERSVTLGIVTPHHYASERRENRLPRRQHSRPSFRGDDDIPGIALTLNPRLQALGLKPSAFNLSG